MAQNANATEAAQSEEITQRSANNTNVSAAAQAEEIVQVLVNDENNTASIEVLRPLQIFLHTIFGLTRTQNAALATDRY